MVQGVGELVPGVGAVILAIRRIEEEMGASHALSHGLDVLGGVPEGVGDRRRSEGHADHTGRLDPPGRSLARGRKKVGNFSGLASAPYANLGHGKAMSDGRARAEGSRRTRREASPPEPPDLPTGKAFVLQLGRETGPTLMPFTGRVEHLATGRRLRFASWTAFQAALIRLLTETEESPT